MVVLAFLAETWSWKQPVDTNAETRVRCGRNVPGLPECHGAPKNQRQTVGAGLLPLGPHGACSLTLVELAGVEVLAAVLVVVVEVLTAVTALLAVAVAAVAVAAVAVAAVAVAAAVPSAKVAVTAAPTPEVVAKPPLT